MRHLRLAVRKSFTGKMSRPALRIGSAGLCRLSSFPGLLWASVGLTQWHSAFAQFGIDTMLYGENQCFPELRT